MDIKLIFEGKAKISDLRDLHRLGYDFIYGNGKLVEIRKDGKLFATAPKEGDR